MKVLHLVTKRQYRGAEVFAANLSAELIKQGHEIIFAGLYQNNKDVLHVPGAENLDLIGSKTKYFSPVLVRELVTLIKKTKPDVIQCNGSDTLKYMIVASYFLPKKTPILYRNISMISKWLKGEPHKTLYKYFLKRIDHVSSVGREAVEDFITTCNYPRKQTSVIRRGIPVREVEGIECRRNLKNDLGLEEEDKIVMHIGNFSPEKNHLFLLQIFSDLVSKQPKIKLVCVGDGLLFENIKMEIEKRNLEKTVFLVGFRKDVAEMLAAADCFVLSSLVEGVPGVVLEAAVQKKPTIATNVGGVSEVLRDGETGYLVDNFNKEVFKERIISLLDDVNLRDRLGKNAYELAMEEYNPEKNARKFESLYLRLIQAN